MDQDQIFTYKIIKALQALGLVVLFFSCQVFANSGESLILCKRDKAVRTLRIEKTDDQHCKAIYTKSGIDKNIGSGQNLESCQGYLAGVRKTLEDAKWSCREINDVQASIINSDSEL